MFNAYQDPPLYLDQYGFFNGAQNDIFEGGSTSSSPPSASSSAPSTHLSSPIAPGMNRLNIESSPVRSSTPAPSPTKSYHHHRPHYYHASEGSCGATHQYAHYQSPHPAM